MDEIRRLEQEINALQAQLRQQNAEAARIRQNLIDENRRNLQSYQSDMRRAINEHDNDTKAEFERLLSQYQRNITDDVQLELAKMDANYNQLLTDVKRNETILLEKNRELEQAISEIRKDAHRKNEGSNQEAKQYLINATDVFKTIEVKPHEKFMPRRLQIFFNAIKDGQQLFKAGLYEAATAVAISAKAGLERLGYTIDDKVDEWDKQFDLLTIKLNYLQTKIQQELIDWGNFVGSQSGNDEEKKKNLIAINYWSRGVFAEIVQETKKIQKVVFDVNTTGKDIYLKSADSAGIEELKQYVNDLNDIDKKLSDITLLYKERYSASCERADWGEAIIDFLTTEINLIWMEYDTGFKKASADTLASKDYLDYIKSQFDDLSIQEDTREWLNLVFKNSSENEIYIYILPIESHGHVTNNIVIHINYDGPEQDLYSQDIYQHVCEAIDYNEDSLSIVNYAKDINELKLSENKVYSETGKDLERLKRQVKN